MGQSFPFNSGIWLTGWGPHTLGGQSTQCTYLNANLIQKHPQRNTQNNAWPVSGHPVAQSSWHKMNHHRILSDHICQFLMLFMSCGWGTGHSEFGIAQELRTLLPPLSCRMTSEHWEGTPETEIYTIQEEKHLFENTNLPSTQTWGRQVLWESQFLVRLIRSLGSLRRRQGSGILKEEERTTFFYPLHSLFFFL